MVESALVEVDPKNVKQPDSEKSPRQPYSDYIIVLMIDWMPMLDLPFSPLIIPVSFTSPQFKKSLIIFVIVACFNPDCFANLALEQTLFF